MTGTDDAFLNPVQWLCPDILAEIFTFCLPDVSKNPRKIHPISGQKAPLLLCSVCSSWRFVATTTPRLWQTLHFCFGFYCMFLTDTESIASGMRTLLDRSRPLPLSIRAIQVSESNEATTIGRLILTILSQEISRWESFEIHTQWHGIWATPPHYGVFSMLHTLDISGPSIDGIPFMAVPRLKRLRLHSHSLNSTSVSGIPWVQLVELSITETRTPISVVLEFIRRSPRLESLSLWVEKGDEDGSLTFRPKTQHDTLRRLHLHMIPYINAVTDHLALPALTDLSLRRACGAMSRVKARLCCSRLVAFFTRSKCELEEFTLFYSNIWPDQLLECLSHKACQTLTHLVIEGSENLPPMVDMELLIRLTYSDISDVTLCPRLAHLELDHCYRSDKSFPHLGRMVQSRCFGRAQESRLRSLRLRCTGYPISMEEYKLLQFAELNGGLESHFSFGLF